MSWSPLDHALGALRRRSSRAIGVALGTALGAFACACALFVTGALRAESLRALDAMPELTVSRLHGGRPAALSAGNAEAIRAVPGVVEVRPRVWGYVPAEGTASLLTVVGHDPSDPLALQGIVRGRGPTPGETGWCVLGGAVSRMLGAIPGDAVELRGVSLRVVGVFDDRVALRTADVVLTAMPNARAILDLGDGEAADLAVTLAAPEERGLAAHRIAEALPWARVLDRSAWRRAVSLAWGRRGGVTLLLLVPSLVALLLLAIDRATAHDARARREAATLKALGFATREVLRVELLTTAIPAAGGLALGAVGAYLYVFPMNAPWIRRVALGWSAQLPDFSLTPAITLADLATLALLALGPQLGAAVWGAWRVAREDPAEALRG